VITYYRLTNRRRLADEKRAQRLRVTTTEGETLYETENPPGDSAAPKTAPAEVTVSSGQLRPEDVIAIVEALAPKPGRESWVGRWAPVLGSVVGAVGLLTVAVINLSDDEPADCVAYVALFSDLRSTVDPADAENLFGGDGLRFGNLEEECGPATPFLTAD
jgi:hypothetical protein